MSQFDLSRFKTKAKTYATTSDGRSIEVRTLEPKTPARVKRKPFKADSIMMPTTWTARLRQARRIGAQHLAQWILEEAFRRKYVGGDVILSTAATGMPRTTRWRAVRELVELELIVVEQRGHEAPRVTKLLNLPHGWKHAPHDML
jgi:hypothetical protein